jgi:hypothetical protein
MITGENFYRAANTEFKEWRTNCEMIMSFAAAVEMSWQHESGMTEAAASRELVAAASAPVGQRYALSHGTQNGRLAGSVKPCDKCPQQILASPLGGKLM